MKEGETILDHMDYINMHLPYSNMGKKALAYLVRHEWRQLPRWKANLRNKLVQKNQYQKIHVEQLNQY